MNLDILIQNARLNDNEETVDVGIKDGIIKEISKKFLIQQKKLSMLKVAFLSQE